MPISDTPVPRISFSKSLTLLSIVHNVLYIITVFALLSVKSAHFRGILRVRSRTTRNGCVSFCSATLEIFEKFSYLLLPNHGTKIMRYLLTVREGLSLTTVSTPTKTAPKSLLSLCAASRDSDEVNLYKEQCWTTRKNDRSSPIYKRVQR